MGARRPDFELDGYRVEQQLGAGSNTRVYRAVDVETEQVVAIKVLVGGQLYEDALARFRREAEAYSSIEHEAVLRMLGTGTVDSGQPYIVLEYIEGGTLRDLLNERRLSLEEVISLGSRLSEALQAVHDRGLVHGDVKPENVFLPGGDPLRAVLGDFGLVDSLDINTGFTMSGIVVGTPLYMSPEQIQGKERSPASDVWALGALLYECSYGRLPFESRSILKLAMQVINEEPTFDPLPNGIERVLAIALAKQPEHRFSDMRSFGRALASPPKHARRLLKVAALLTAVCVLLLALGLTHQLGPEDSLSPVMRRVVDMVRALPLGVAIAVLVYVVLSALERRRQQRHDELVSETKQVRRRVDVAEVLSRSIATSVEALLAESAAHPTIDLRRASLALAIDDFRSAKDRDEQRVALERAIAIAEVLRQQQEHFTQPWYVRHKEGLTLATALLAAAAAVLSSLAGVLK